LRKFYDKVDWEFLCVTLQGFGFPFDIIHLTMSYIFAITYSLKWNDVVLNSFVPSLYREMSFLFKRKLSWGCGSQCKSQSLAL